MTQQHTILCFGDSLTAGYRLPSAHSYPSVLQQLLKNNGHICEVINAGVSGDTTVGGLRRVDRYLSGTLHMFILELGINDGLRGMSLNQMERNLHRILQKVKENHPEAICVLAGMQLPEIINNRYISHFTSIYPAVAEACEALLIPSFLKGVLLNPALNLPDMLHPNAAGYRIIANTVHTAIKPSIAVVK